MCVVLLLVMFHGMFVCALDERNGEGAKMHSRTTYIICLHAHTRAFTNRYPMGTSDSCLAPVFDIQSRCVFLTANSDCPKSDTNAHTHTRCRRRANNARIAFKSQRSGVAAEFETPFTSCVLLRNISLHTISAKVYQASTHTHTRGHKHTRTHH